MKKIAKLSLVAAVAVAGLSTSLSAKALEEAIKNVDVSGTAAYRYDDRNDDDSGYTKNSYKVAVNLKSKINDDLTFNSRTIIGSDNANAASTATNGSDMVGLHTSGADHNAGFALSRANFAYTGLANTTIIAGKQAVPSPFAVQADAAGDEDNGTGLTAVVNAGPVTVAATYLNQTNLLTAGQDIAGLGLMTNAGPVALDAWYLEVLESSDANSGHQAYTLGAKAKIDVVSLYARYSAISHDSTGTDTESLTKIGAKAKIGIVGFGVDYGFTNDVNTATSTAGTGINLTGDADAKVNMQGWALNLSDSNSGNSDDASLLKLNVNADVMSGINLSANYNMYKTDRGSNLDAKEYYGQLTHKAGKNFMYYVRIGQTDYESKTDKGTRGRLHVQYSF